MARVLQGPRQGFVCFKMGLKGSCLHIAAIAFTSLRSLNMCFRGLPGAISLARSSLEALYPKPKAPDYPSAAAGFACLWWRPPQRHPVLGLT